MKLEFAIEQQSVYLLGNNEIIADSKNYVYANFRFSQDWKDLVKQVHFKRNSPSDVHIILVLDGNNSVLVPHEVLDHKGEFTVHIAGSDGHTTITTNPLTVFISENGIISDDNSATPTPDYLIESVTKVAMDRQAVAEDRAHVDEVASVLEQHIEEKITSASQEAAEETSRAIIQEVREITSDAIGVVETAKSEALSGISETKEQATADVNAIKTSALSDISNANSNALGGITSAGFSAISSIEFRESGAVREINDARLNSLNDISTQEELSIREIRSVGSQSTTLIYQTGVDAENSINTLKTTSLNAIDNARGEVMEELGGLVEQAGTSETNAKASEDNAKASELLAKQYRDEAESFAPQGYNNLISKVDTNERRISALYDLGEGKTHRFETSTDEAYTKQIPSGAKCFDLKMLGGKSEVIDGTLVNHKVTDVVVRGKNLFEVNANRFVYQHAQNNYTISNDTITVTKVFVLMKVGKLSDFVGKTVTLSANVTSESYSFELVYCDESGGNRVAITRTTSKTDGNRLIRIHGNIADRNPNDLVCIRFYVGNGDIPCTYSNIMVEVSDSVTSYSPYQQPQTKQVPQAIRDINGYGWSAGTVCNYVDIERKKFVKCVDRVDMGSLEWVYDSTVPRMRAPQFSNVAGVKLPAHSGIVPNVLCEKFITTNWDNYVATPKSVGVYHASGWLVVHDTDYTDASAFKSAMSGVYLYYELAEPIEIDIDLDDRFSAIECEGNGSITFEGDSGYNLPIPNTEEFLVKLSEV